MKLFYKITGIAAAIIVAVTVSALDSVSLLPLVLTCICCAYIVFLFLIHWDDIVRWEEANKIEDFYRRNAK